MPSRDVVPYIDVKFIDPVVPPASGWIAVGWPFASASSKNSWSPDDEIVSPKNPSACSPNLDTASDHKPQSALGLPGRTYHTACAGWYRVGECVRDGPK